ncbi:hypothetical protein K470DRAFT_210901 [Piedraia hortae CBS 480.64]|uniref:1-phosphatidylinositol-3-phosphate 5-kinase n=1 Tax=Piedraia hortae CBS 480.64 TaxID=1314780 RepID=A0A6A7C762_9PEZI|nr:hypothetical protein K470DRAFT_210901 [Piedraia hortae CBS 480.64]
MAGSEDGHLQQSSVSSSIEVQNSKPLSPDSGRAETATQALSRVLTHHEELTQTRPSKGARLSISASVSPSDSGSLCDVILGSHSTTSFTSQPSLDPALKLDASLEDIVDQLPPECADVLQLPGLEPSRASSTTEVAKALPNKVAATTQDQRPEASQSLQSHLERSRRGLKPPPQESPGAAYVPSHVRRRVVSKEFWMKDENAKDCFNCGDSFSTFRRKHHCRACGQIFDAKCTILVPGRPFGQSGTLRLCKPCEALIYGSDDDSTIVSDDGDEHPSRVTGHQLHDIRESGSLLGNSISRAENNEIATPSIGIPASRRNRESKRRSAIIEFDTQPALARPSSSHSLVSMSLRPRSSSHRRLSRMSRPFKSSVDERAPFHQELVGDPEKKRTLPVFHNDNIIDPDLAPFLYHEAIEDDDAQTTNLAMEQSASLGERDRLPLPMASRKSRPRPGERGFLSSSIGSAKDEELFSKQASRISRKRRVSIGNISVKRLSPRRAKGHLLISVDSDHPDSPTTSTPSSKHVPDIISSASLHGSATPPGELNEASLHHVRRLLAQLLHDHKIEAASTWEKALLPIVLQCADGVDPDVQQGDDMDIRHYIKLKKMPGGSPGDTSYVSGVVFGKNVALKSMARSIRNPRIAIVTFSIEYARHQPHFMSLDPVIAQEREYLHNLVGRIAALKPTLLFVQRNVSGLALRLLEKAGITVAFNIKASVLAAVARLTQTSLIKSVDKLAIHPSLLGSCERFGVKTFVTEGVRKTYTYLSGCPPNLGCTIVLRGADTKTLRKIKRITEFMCFVAYNLKLETTLMRDEFASTPSFTEDQLQSHDLNRHCNSTHRDLETPSIYERLEEESRSRILSASPFIAFMQPYILTQLRESEVKLATFKKLRDQYAAADEEGGDENGTDDFVLVKPEWVNAPASKDQPKAVRDYLRAVYQAQYDKTAHTYATQKRLWESFMNTGTNPFDPFSHQSISVLHSVVSNVTSAPCEGPEVLTIDFYVGYSRAESEYEEDCTLGQYIEDICLSAGSACKECGKNMVDHHRQYVHGNGQLSVSVQHLPPKLGGMSDKILMWSACRICRVETSVVPMLDKTWKYSFAKYLELSFWSRPLHPRAGLCEHDLHKDFLRFFGFQNVRATLRYDPIDIYDLVVPRSTVTWKVESDLAVKNEQYVLFFSRLKAFSESVKKRLNSINVDTLDEKKVAEANEKLETLRQRADEEYGVLLAKLQEKYATSRYYELIPLNRALRLMDEKAIVWDEEFSNFDRDYLPSETDIRKLATLQLRNMFLESQPSSKESSEAEETELKELSIKSEGSDPENALDAMSSAIEEHRSSQDTTSDLDAEKDSLAGPLNRILTPQEELQVVEREEVKHLDLAVSPKVTDEFPIEALQSPVDGKKSVDNGTKDGEPFATQPKPLSTGLLERIEQIRNNRSNTSTDGPEQPASRIPRPNWELNGVKPPSLNRAQSQPGHVSRKSTDLHDTGPEAGSDDRPKAVVDKRIGERLGVGRLANKVGKVGQSFIPRSVPFKSEDTSNHSVSALAKHFEEMSREFEKERLKERRQRALRSRQARANPLASSRPVVEVYHDATEAVGEAAAEEGQERNAQAPVSRPEESKAEPKAQTPRRHNDTEGENKENAVDGDDARSNNVSDQTSVISSTTMISPTSLVEMELPPELSISEQKKNVWFKNLADFWSNRSASGWANLDYPLHATEHVFEDSDIIVREDEPSSVIALSLACSDYQQKVQDFRSMSAKTAQTVDDDPDEEQKAIEASLLSDTGTHMKYSFAHGQVKASCKIFYAESFDALRRRCGVSSRFVDSMSRSLKFDSKGGKTKSLFLKTLDNRFIIKSLQEVELKAFTKFAPDYFSFMSHTLFHGVPSVMAKMFGLFQVTIKNPSTGMDFSSYLLVMENLFYERSPTRRFDLKGSMRNRKIESTGQPDEVLLDENLVETIFESPLFVREHARRLVQASVWNDTMFLSRQNVMDYSLMAGFDDTRKELIIGIIDCIRTYTWDKKLESWIKDRGKNKPTITSPRDYRNRFRMSMMAYILQAPTPWLKFQGTIPKELGDE